MKKTVFLFAGQGAQSVGMARDFYEQMPIAKILFEKANILLGYDLADICFRGPEEMLTKTDNAQPAIYLHSWVALTLLQERVPGLTVEATAGLSLGEFTALAAAGVMTFEEGLQVVGQRGQFMREACEVTRGTMAAVIGLNETATRAVCEESGVQLANLNCPDQLVISGTAEGVAKACELAKTRGAKRALVLPVAGAYHSSLMASAQPKLRQALGRIPLKNPTIPVMSNVTGKPHETAGEIVDLLVAQVTASVRWEDSMRYLISQGYTRFIELGPGGALSGFMKRIDKSMEMLSVSDVASLESTVKALQS